MAVLGGGHHHEGEDYVVAHLRADEVAQVGRTRRDQTGARPSALSADPAPPLDRAATKALVGRLYPSRHLVQTEDGCLDVANPPDAQIYAGCFPSLTIICTSEVALDHPLTTRHKVPG